MRSLKEELAEWQDFDSAEFVLGVTLGVVEADFQKTKWVYWTDNPLGSFLYETLKGMVKIGTLEFDEEEDKFRWKQEAGQ